jgi:hypothetical protein
MPGVFDHQLNAANRFHANYEHERGIGNVVGHGISLRRSPRRLPRVVQDPQDLERRHRPRVAERRRVAGVSLEAVAKKSVRSAAGVVQRVKANLRGIAFCRHPAFAGAQVGRRDP